MIRWNPAFDTMQPGPVAVVGMPAGIYHATERVSASLLAKFHVDEDEGDMYLSQPESVGNMAMAFGTAFHSAVLEPEDFAARLLVREDIGPASEVKMAKAQSEHPHRIILANGWLQQIEGIIAKCRRHPAVYELVLSDIGQRAFKELSLFWSETVRGDTVLCKARLDYWHQDWSLCADVKTTASAKRIDFEQVMGKLAYPLRAAWYLRGVQACGLATNPDFVWLPMERSKPHRVDAIGASGRCLDQGWGEACHALHTLIDYLRRGRILTTPPARIQEHGDIPVYHRVPDDFYAAYINLMESPTHTPNTEGMQTWTTSRTLAQHQAASSPRASTALSSAEAN